MAYIKTDWKNDGGSPGGDAALTNLENGVNIAHLGSVSTRDQKMELVLSTSMDYSAKTSGWNQGVGYFDAYIKARISPNADDLVVFDPQSCKVLSIDYFSNTTGITPSVINTNVLGARENDQYITWEYCGRKYENIQKLTPVDNGTTIDVTFPGGHGLPLNSEGLRCYISSGGLEEEGETGIGLTVTILQVTDAETITVPMTLSVWNNQMARSPKQHFYLLSAIWIGAGGQDMGAGGTLNLNMHWAWDVTHPNFYKSLASDG